MSVESTLVKALDIRFIDARLIATEAKLNMGIDGYPKEDQVQDIIKESMRIYELRPTEDRIAMKTLHNKLNRIKSMSSHSSNSDDGSSSGDEPCCKSAEFSVGSSSKDSTTSGGRRSSDGSFKFKMWPTKVLRRPSWD